MKEGDIVTISPYLEELETAKKPYPFELNTGMLNLHGQQAKITSVKFNFYDPSNYPDYPNVDGNLYRINLDNGKWAWANIMFTEKHGVGFKIVEEEL